MASEVFSARDGGVNPINQVTRSSNVARSQAKARQEVTAESFDAKIREVVRKGIRGDYGAYDTPIIMGDMERAKARYDGDYWKSEALRLQAEVRKNSGVNTDKMPILDIERSRIISARNNYHEAVEIWNRIRKSDDYKRGRKAIERLKKAGFTQKEIKYYAER